MFKAILEFFRALKTPQVPTYAPVISGRFRRRW